MITIGIDPSINSTGICVYTKTPQYYIISSKQTKKNKAFRHPRITMIFYDKLEMKDLEYSERENAKSFHILQIINALDWIIHEYNEEIQVRMEGVSYGSKGGASLVDLAGLNFCIREYLMEKNIPFRIVPPTTLKKASTGNANAQKEEMIYMWKKLDPEMESITEIKIDDLADAFFLSRLDSERSVS